MPFLSEHFKQAIYIWNPYDQSAMDELVEQVKPDIVIEERGEGNLFRMLSPVTCHNIIARDFLENDVDVLIEKPMTTTPYWQSRGRAPA